MSIALYNYTLSIVRLVVIDIVLDKLESPESELLATKVEPDATETEDGHDTGVHAVCLGVAESIGGGGQSERPSASVGS